MIEIRIAFDPATGKIEFSGPMDNRLLVYGLLDVAKDIVRDQPKSERKIIPAFGPLPNLT